MPLKLRPTGLGSGIDKDRPDYAVCVGEWEVGRIYQTRGGLQSLRWFWSMTVNGPAARVFLVGPPGPSQLKSEEFCTHVWAEGLGGNRPRCPQ